MKLIQLLLLFNFNSLTILWLKTGSVDAIIGGQDAKINQFKYQILLLANNKYVCSGAIISDIHVLTAAHCMLDDNCEFIQERHVIVAGVINIEDKSDRRVEVEVKQIYIPKEYRCIRRDNRLPDRDESGDIAVLLLNNNLNLDTSNLIALTLPQISDNYPKYANEKPVVSGFGAYQIFQSKNKSGKITSTVFSKGHKLKFAKTTVLSNEKCAPMFTIPIHNKQICAQIQQDRQPAGACMGDSGSPLVLNDNIIIGVLASLTPHCNEKYHASIYTRVTSFLPFILKAMRDEKSEDIRLIFYKIEKKGKISEGTKNLVEVVNV